MAGDAEDKDRIIRELRAELDAGRREREEIQNQLAEARLPNIPCTFLQLLANCHQQLATINVQRNPTKSTQGSVGTPGNRLVPSHLCSWSDFPTIQAGTFGAVKAIHDQRTEPPATFLSPENLRYVRENYPRTIASELDIRQQQQSCIENIVRAILTDLIADQTHAQAFNLGEKVAFDNHANELTENDDEETKRALFADKIFMQKMKGGAFQLVLVIEYKPPHKLNIPTLEAGLKDLRCQDVINRAKTSTNKNVKFIEQSEQNILTVLAQIYTYMIDSGIQYGYITTGEAFIFLYLEDQRTDILYYHMVIPTHKNADGINIDIFDTAIAQVLSFCIHACSGELYDQDERAAHRDNARHWTIDEDAVMDSMTPSPERPPTPSSEFRVRSERGTAAQPDASLRRQTRSLTSRDRCKDQDSSIMDEDLSDSSNDVMDPKRGPLLPPPSQTPKSPTPQPGRKRKHQAGSETKCHEKYCTHKCLLGLTNNSPPDRLCPNYQFHPTMRTKRRQERHAIGIKDFQTLLHNQLQRTMNTSIQPLGIQGARSALFKITLESHSYTVIGKGTPPHYVRHLRHERTIYDHLHELQGTTIPVCLGAIDSPRCYFYDVDVNIYYWLLLSFAGQPLDLEQSVAKDADIKKIWKQLYRRGISHRDISENNCLWDEQSQTLMVIDFERSRFVEQRGKGKEDEVEQKKVSKETDPNPLMTKRKAVEEGGEEDPVRPSKMRVL